MKHIEVVAAILIKQHKVFSTCRGYGPYQGQWEFPGGKIEAGETHTQALIREIKEELDTEIAVDDPVSTLTHTYPDFSVTLHFYRCHILSGELLLKEHQAARWLGSQQLTDVNWLPADLALLPVIRKLLL